MLAGLAVVVALLCGLAVVSLALSMGDTTTPVVMDAVMEHTNITEEPGSGVEASGALSTSVDIANSALETSITIE